MRALSRWTPREVVWLHTTDSLFASEQRGRCAFGSTPFVPSKEFFRCSSSCFSPPSAASSDSSAPPRTTNEDHLRRCSTTSGNNHPFLIKRRIIRLLSRRCRSPSARSRRRGVQRRSTSFQQRYINSVMRLGQLQKPEDLEHLFAEVRLLYYVEGRVGYCYSIE